MSSNQVWHVSYVSSFSCQQKINLHSPGLMGWGNIYKRRIKVFALAMVIYLDYKVTCMQFWEKSACLFCWYVSIVWRFLYAVMFSLGFTAEGQVDQKQTQKGCLMEKSSWTQCKACSQLYDRNGGFVGKTWTILVHTCWCTSRGLYTPPQTAAGFPSSSTFRGGYSYLLF